MVSVRQGIRVSRGVREKGQLTGLKIIGAFVAGPAWMHIWPRGRKHPEPQEKSILVAAPAVEKKGKLKTRRDSIWFVGGCFSKESAGKVPGLLLENTGWEAFLGGKSPCEREVYFIETRKQTREALGERGLPDGRGIGGEKTWVPEE